MSTGEGIVWATCLVLIALGIKRISQIKRWRLIGITAISIVGLGIIIGLGIYFYDLYKNKPVRQNSLFGVTLKMEPVDVRLILGKPKNEVNIKEEDILFYTYQTYSWEGMDKYVKFKKQNKTYNVYAICDLDPDGELYGLYTFTKEDEVIRKFNQPTNKSINKDGLSKFLTFGNLNIAVEIEKQEVTTVCVTSNKIDYTNEYNSLNEN